MKHIYLGTILVLTGALFAQDIQVNRQNKTISVIAEESVTADPEVATVVIGYHNYGATHDLTFQENVRVSNQVTKALLDAHVPKDNIETATLRFERVDADEKWTPEMRKERQFQASQSWRIRVPATQAHVVLDIATHAGANRVDEVAWEVADPSALQAKASGAALAKARAIAEQMAKGLNAKLGELVYASNRSPEENNRFVEAFWSRQNSITVSAVEVEATPQVVLYPQKVVSHATVYAVFAIE